MKPAAVITGKVVDLDGDPMRSVTVSALRVGSAVRWAGFHDSITNDLGEYRISDLQEGRYTIQALPPQEITQILAVSGKTFFVGGDSTNVYAGSKAFVKTSDFLFLLPAPPG
jgi:hypothetical protein